MLLAANASEEPILTIAAACINVSKAHKLLLSLWKESCCGIIHDVLENQAVDPRLLQVFSFRTRHIQKAEIPTPVKLSVIDLLVRELELVTIVA